MRIRIEALGEFSDHQIVLAQYSSAKWWDYVEAWQPLPEPYKEGGE